MTHIKEFWEENKKFALVIGICLIVMACLIGGLKHSNRHEYLKKHPIKKPFDMSDGIQVGVKNKNFEFDVVYYKNENAIGLAGLIDHDTRYIIRMDSVEQFKKDIQIAYDYYKKWLYIVDTMGIESIDKVICVFPTIIVSDFKVDKSDNIKFKLSKDIHFENNKVYISRSFNIVCDNYPIALFWETETILPNKKVLYENKCSSLVEMLKVLDVNYIKNCKNKILFNYQKVEMFNKIAN